MLIIAALLASFVANAESDIVVNFTVQNKIGYEQIPLVQFEVKIDSPRDFHVAVKDLNNNWKQVTAKTTRVPQSGKYHFEMPIEDFKPGKYKWNAYLTPRGKNWNDRVGEQVSQTMVVVNKPSFEKQIKFSAKDAIKKVSWPKLIEDNAEYVLSIDFQITEPRDLIIKLLNANGWEKLGEIKIPVTQPGNLKLPIQNVLTDYGSGKYAWVAIVADKQTEKQVGKKLGRPFTVK